MDCTEVDHSNSPSTLFVVVVVAFVELCTFKVSLIVCGKRTIVTNAILMSFRIINDTRNPDHDRKYNTNRAGIRSIFGETNNEKEK